MGFLTNPFFKKVYDVIGNLIPIQGGQTISDNLYMGYKHIHNPALCYPTLAPGRQVNTGAGNWELGEFAELIPANIITDAYDVHWVNFESSSATGVYELHLFAGVPESEVLIATIRTSRDTNQSGTTNVPVQIPPLHANTRLSAKVAGSSGNRNVVVSVFYHTYGEYSFHY